MNKHETHKPEPSPSTEEILAEAQRRMAQREAPEPALTPVNREKAVRGTNRLVFWLSRHWLALFNFLLLLYVGGAFLAPLLAQWGRTAESGVLYRLYGPPVCHQYPVRSWFLFGEQAAYGLEDPLLPEEVEKTAAFVGDAQLGYKVAFCQRDVAIYLTALITGLAFGIVRRFHTVKPPPLWVVILVSVVPMAIDGGYQLLTQILAFVMPGTIIPHETTPLLRTLTGALFGFGLVIFAYSHFNVYFSETRQLLSNRYGWSTSSKKEETYATTR